MKKILAVIAVILLTSTVTATTIAFEDVRIDLSDNSVKTTVKVQKLTSTAFTYTSSYNIENFNATMETKPLDCEITDITPGNRIICDVEDRENFTVHLRYTANNLISEQSGVKVFRYRHPIYRPTKNYRLEVILPRGGVLLENSNTSTQVISPQGFQTGSNGRRISVSWNLNPQLGETLTFLVLYEKVGDSGQTKLDLELLARILTAATVVILVLAGLLRWKRQDLSDIYEELDEDERKVLELLEENDGEYLQKDLVDDMDYSKAKISGIVSEMVDKGLLKKSKEGRSNKLTISRKYRY
ncbi:MAG: helix-turn-helix transcriptional regulator [Candidatus Nanosalina sp.]